MPRAQPSGRGVPQPDISATMSSALSQSSRSRKLGIPRDQLAPVLVGVLAGGVRQLVDEAFEIEDIHAAAGRTPESDRNVAVAGVDVVMAHREMSTAARGGRAPPARRPWFL